MRPGLGGDRRPVLELAADAGDLDVRRDTEDALYAAPFKDSRSSRQHDDQRGDSEPEPSIEISEMRK
jgi:hypothetical protein